MKENYVQLINEKIIIKDILEYVNNSSIDIEEFNKYMGKYTQEYMPQDILLEREERVYRQEKLIEKYNSSLICMRVNYPGISKNNHITIGIIKILCDVIIKQFRGKILYKIFNISAEGPILTIVVDEAGNTVKEKTIAIEEGHFLGRFVDIDVYNHYNNTLSRKDFGMKSRKCYICDNYAQICVRNRSHDEDEIKIFIKNRYDEYCKLNNI